MCQIFVKKISRNDASLVSEETDFVSAVAVLAHRPALCQDRSPHAFAQTEWCRLDAGLVSKSFIDKALQQFLSAFHDEALNASTIEVGHDFLEVLTGVDDGRRAAVQ